MQKNLIIILILAIIISIFAILNAGAAPINLFFTTLEISIALVILISATLGAVIVFSLDTASKYRYRKELRESQRQNEKLETENRELREKNRWYESELARFREAHHEQTRDEGTKTPRYRWDPKPEKESAEKSAETSTRDSTRDSTREDPYPFTDPWSRKKAPKDHQKDDTEH